MGYPENIKASIRKVAPNVVTLSCPFTMFNRCVVGMRLAILKYGDEVVVWSPLPYGPHVEEALDLLGAKKRVDYIIVVNTNHNLAVDSYLEKFPSVKVIGGEYSHSVSYKFDKTDGNRVISGDEAATKFADTGLLWHHLEFVYLPEHGNQELAVFEKNHKILLEADILMDIAEPDENGELEQYSPATGYPSRYNPFQGWSWLIRFVRRNDWLGWCLHAFMGRVWRDGAAKGLQVIYDSWDFKIIIQTHGNNITRDPKAVYRAFYPWVESGKY